MIASQTPSVAPVRSSGRRIHPLILILLAFCALLGACEKSGSAGFKPRTGQIQILNGSGKSGVAEDFRNFLTGYGFDVIESGNARDWNYEHTMVIARAVPDRIGGDLAKVLGTPRVLHLQQQSSLAEATVIIGKDYKELMQTWPLPGKN